MADGGMSYDPYDQESTRLDVKTLSTARTPSLPKGHTISAFVPEKPDSFRPFAAKFRAMLPPQYAAALDIGGDMRGWTGPRVDGCTRWHFENRRERRGRRRAERRADERRRREREAGGGCTLCAQLRKKNLFFLAF